MRANLWKSIGLAMIQIDVAAIALQRVLNWLAGAGEAWAEQLAGGSFHGVLEALSWVVSIAAGLGVVFGAIFLMPAVTSLVASVFVDDVADHVERKDYPAELPGQPLPIVRARFEGGKTAGLTVLVYLVALPFLFFAGLGLVVFFLATAWLLGREYFELAAMRFRSPAQAKALRKHHSTQVFIAGLFIAAFASIPIVILATPLFCMSFMVLIHMCLSAPRPELLEPERKARLQTFTE